MTTLVKDTGLGRCPRCGGTNLMDVSTNKGDWKRIFWAVAAGLAGLILCFPLVFVLPALALKAYSTDERMCWTCNYHWPKPE